MRLHRRMMRTISLVMLLLCAVGTLFADSVDSKRNELQEIERQIAESERLVQEAETRSSGAQRDLQAGRKRYSRITGSLQELEAQEKRLSNELSAVQADLAQAALRVEVLGNLCREEFYELFRSDVDELLQLGEAPDPMLLVLLLNTTAAELDKHEGELTQLDRKHSERRQEWSNTQEERRSVTEQKQKTRSQLSRLETQIADIEREKQDYLARIDDLRERAQAIEEIIARLTLEPVTEEYSFRFSRDTIAWPVRGKVVRPFGEYRGNDPRIKFFNNGIDISAPVGTEVGSIDDGVVVFAEFYPRTGKVVIVDHQNGYLSSYSHINTLLVSVGDEVKRGQPVATSGASTDEEPIVHFELRKRREPVDPAPFLEKQ